MAGKVSDKTLRGSVPPKLINDVIRFVMAERGVTHREMAASIGMPGASAVGARLNSNNMTFDRAIEMLEVLGYEVVVQPRRETRSDDQIVLVRSDTVQKGGASE